MATDYKFVFSKNLKKYMEINHVSAVDIARHMGVSKSIVSDWCNARKLPRMDKIERLAVFFGIQKSNLIDENTDHIYPRPVVTNDTVTLPVIGDLAAGYDAIALEDWQGDTVEIPRSYLKGRSEEEYIVLCVKGDSMYPAYRQGDKVLILRQEDVPFSGAVGAVRYEDELVTLKIVEKRIGDDGKAFIRLKPINPQYPPLEIRGEALDHYGVVGIPRLLIREVEEE